MNQDQIEKILKAIQTTMRCPNCGSHYELNRVSFLAETSRACLVHLTCSNCSIPAVATFVVSQQTDNIPTLDEITGGFQAGDIGGMFEGFPESQTAAPTEPQEKVTTDDVIEMHEFLKGFNGDFEDQGTSKQ